MNYRFAFIVLAALVPVGSWGAEIDYHTDIAPVLRDYCGGCHNDTEFEGDFSIETFASLMTAGESGKASITPGKPGESHLADLIQGKGRRPMPPKKEPQPSAEQVRLILRWIEAGARGPRPGEDKSILATLHVPQVPKKHSLPAPVTAAAYSPDGKSLATGSYGAVRLEGRTFPVEGKVNALHFSPDGKKLIAAGGITGVKGVATVWDLASGKVDFQTPSASHRDILYDAEFSPDGRLIATAGYDRVIRLWNAAGGAALRSIEGHNGAVFDLAFSPDSSLLASASGDETCKIWRVSDGLRLDTLNQPEGEQFRVAFTPDGRNVVATGADKKIRLWKLVSTQSPKINPVIQARFAHEETVSAMALSPDGKWLASSSADRTIKIWSLPDLRQVKTIGGQPDLVAALAFGPDQSLFVSRMNGSQDTQPPGEMKVSAADSSEYREPFNQVKWSRGDAVMTQSVEKEGESPLLALPAEVKGTIGNDGDTDDYRFQAKKGDTMVLEINAARSGSKLDSKLEILTPAGEKVERLVLQAVRDSYFTFRGKDSNTSDDFRVHNWREMELNEFLYAGGEVVKLWHYPRGPDSGFRVYPGFGNRITWFDTTPLSQALGAPCYIVEAHPPGSEPSPNGLPVFRLHWENDDDGARQNGSDSRIHFIAPGDGEYLARVSDTRKFGGNDFHYTLTIRPPRPDFTVTHNGAKLKISPGGGREIEFSSMPADGFEGEVQIALENLPPGYFAAPVAIEPGQRRACMAVYAAPDAAQPGAEQVKQIKIAARATVNGQEISHQLSGFTEFGVSAPSKVNFEILPDGDSGKLDENGILELTVPAGETVSAIVRAERSGFDGQIDFGKDESGRNLPHGVFVDNIGLNGLMIPAGQDQQRFWITAAKWVPETVRLFHLATKSGGEQITRPVKVRVVRR